MKGKILILEWIYIQSFKLKIKAIIILHSKFKPPWKMYATAAALTR